MKKLFAMLSASLLALCLLVGCSKMGSVTKAFEKAEYTVTTQTIEEENSVIKSIATVEGKLSILDGGILIELGSTEDLDNAIEELRKDKEYKAVMDQLGADAKAIHAKLEEAGLVNKNVIFVSYNPEAIKIFKNA